MRKYLAVAVLLLLCLALLSGSAGARDWFVSTSGNDSTGDGTINNPYATPQTAFTQTQPGDTVQIRAGTYSGGITVWGGGYKSGAPGAPITVRAYDGYLTAHIGRLALQPVSYLNFEGLDVAMDDVQPINLCGIETSWRVYNRCHHLQFRHCKFTLTDTDGTQGADELFKCAQTDYLLVEDCELTVASGAHDKASVGQDFVSVNYATMRRAFVHDYQKCGIYWKGGSWYDILEDSVIANGRTDYCPNSGLAIGGDGSGWEFASTDTNYGTEYTVVRNNIVRGNSKAGLLMTSSDWCWVYNNLLADVANIVPICGVGSEWGYVNCMTFPGNDHGDNLPPNHTRLYNNIFLDTAGIMTKAYQNQLGGTLDFVTGNNCYYNGGNSVPAGDLQGVDPANESGAVFANPNLTLSGTPTTWQGWVDYYRPTSNSTAIRDAGNSNAGVCPRPGRDRRYRRQRPAPRQRLGHRSLRVARQLRDADRGLHHLLRHRRAPDAGCGFPGLDRGGAHLVVLDLRR